jgi:hypothetical protein
VAYILQSKMTMTMALGVDAEGLKVIIVLLPPLRIYSKKILIINLLKATLQPPNQPPFPPSNPS